MTNDQLMRLVLQVSMLTRRYTKSNDAAQGGGLPFDYAPDGFMKMRFPPPPVPVGEMTWQKLRGKGAVLSILSKEDGVTQKNIADAMFMRPPSLSELLHKMEGEGLVERRTNETDRREVLVYITDEGRRIATMVAAEHERRADKFFSALSDEEKDSLAAILKKLLDSQVL